MRRFFMPMVRDVPHIEPPYCYRCPFHLVYPECGLACAQQLERAILLQGPESVAAFVAEPVGGATQGGVVPPDGYWPLIREICDRYEVMLIADEVLTGFGRTGTWFAMDLFQVQPDVIAMAKGATGGYFPISITAVKGADVETIRTAHGDFNHGGTFSHHAVGAATALAVLDYMEDNRLVERAAENGAYLGRELERLYELPCVGDVRGMGMMWGVEFVADRATKETLPGKLHYGYRVCDRCREMGVLLYPGSGCVDGKRGDHLMVAPPFVATREELDVIVETLGRAIGEVWGEVF
jgi:adenosylmethionine-8-amino-7-oxononanoate aminotransferase